MKFSCIMGNGIVKTMEIPDEKLNQMREKRRNEIAAVQENEAMLIYKWENDREVRTRYKIYRGQVILIGVTGLTGEQYQDLQYQAKAWSDRKLVEKTKRRN